MFTQVYCCCLIMWTGVQYYMRSRNALSSLDVTKYVDFVAFDLYSPHYLRSSECITQIMSMSSWVYLPTQSSKALRESALGHIQLLYRPLPLLVSKLYIIISAHLKVYLAPTGARKQIRRCPRLLAHPSYPLSKLESLTRGAHIWLAISCRWTNKW